MVSPVSAVRKETQVANSKAQFVLRGFHQTMAFRVFTFEGIAADRVRSLFTIRADLTLARRYRIPLQELPLLCRAVLERLHDGGDKRAFAYTEEDMRLFANIVTARAEAAKQRRPPRRPATDNVGAGFRGPQS